VAARVRLPDRLEPLALAYLARPTYDARIVGLFGAKAAASNDDRPASDTALSDAHRAGFIGEALLFDDSPKIDDAVLALLRVAPGRRV
jgi:hypothetical protein